MLFGLLTSAIAQLWGVKYKGLSPQSVSRWHSILQVPVFSWAHTYSNLQVPVLRWAQTDHQSIQKQMTSDAFWSLKIIKVYKNK